MKKSIGLMLLFLSIIYQNTTAQDLQKYYVSMGIKLGYTFGAGFTYGATLDAGVKDNSYLTNGKYGISISYALVNVKKYTHRMRTFNFMAQNDFACIKTGIGSVRNPWGYGKRNKCIVHGFNLDLSATYPNQFSPWIGVSYFKFQRANWAWFDKPYSTLYLNYKYNTLDMFHNTQPDNRTAK